MKKNFLTVLYTVIALAVLSFFTYLAAVFPVWANIPLCVIIPIFLIIFVSMTRFEKIKISTLIIGRSLILLVVFAVMPQKVFIYIVVALMFVNCMEAALTDWKKGHHLNAVAGIVVAMTSFVLLTAHFSGFNGEIGTLFNGKMMNTGWYTTGTLASGSFVIFWAIAYTIWNWNFVNYEFSPAIATWHIAVLTTPFLLLLIFKDAGMWFLTRALSITLCGVFQISFKQKFENAFKNENFAKGLAKVKNQNVQVVLLVLVVIFAMLAVMFGVQQSGGIAELFREPLSLADKLF